MNRDDDTFTREYSNIWESTPTEIPTVINELVLNPSDTITLSPEERTKLIDRLNRSFLEMPRWVQTSCKHAMGAPTNHPVTGKKFESFLEVIEASSDYTLLSLKEDFTENDDLLPE
jgi:hypothetical protein